MKTQRKRIRKRRLPAVLLSGVLAVATLVTAPVTSQAAETGNTELQNLGAKTTYYDTVYFGSYLQEDTNGDGKVDQKDKKQPIRWRILSQKGNDAYVLADKVLDCKKYNEEFKAVTWETCTLRKWLNNDFYNTAFSSAEQGAIIEQTLKNEDNEEYGTAGGNDTKDKVYLPSLSDVKNPAYGFLDNFDGDQASIGKATSYAEAQGVYTYKEMSCWWWLRSPGYSTDCASDVLSYGYVTTLGSSVSLDIVGVRPALHLNLSSSLVKKGERIDATGKTVKKDNPTTINIKNKKTYKTSKKITVNDKDGIKTIKLNSKTIKVKNKESYSFKLSKYKKNLKKKGKWNKLVVTDKNGKKTTIQFKTK